MKIAIYTDVEIQDENIDFIEISPSIKSIDRFLELNEFLDKIKEDQSYDAAFLQTSGQEGFLMKSVQIEQLQKILERLNNEWVSVGEKLFIRYKGKLLSIPMDEILYLESQLHKVNIVLTSKIYQCNERLEHISARLSRKFLKCHKSYIINMDYISEFCKKEIVIHTGQKIPVSKTCYTDAKQKIYDYLNVD